MFSKILNMDKILSEQNPHWIGERYDGFMQRAMLPVLLEQIELEEMLVLSGVRRCGKTTLFRHLINHLLSTANPRSILYINLDDPFFAAVNKDAKHLYEIVETAEKINDHKIAYVFFDEIQNVTAWEKYVKSVYDSRIFKKIFITGSNAQLLESEYATLLSGRYIQETIYPLSFKECLQNRNITDKLTLLREKSTALSIFENLLHYGGFPRAYLEKNKKIKRKILTGYYTTILLKDCTAANNVRDVRLMSQLSHYVLTNVSARYSYNKLSQALDSNENTIKEYIKALEKGFLFNEILNFSFSPKKQIRGSKKAYCIDNGLITAVAFQFQLIHGKLFENLVYTELKKQGADEVYLFNEANECDFIVKQQDQCIAIQVCHTLNAASRQREFKGLALGMEKSKASKGYIITYDQEEKVSDNMFVIPFWKGFGLMTSIEELF